MTNIVNFPAKYKRTNLTPQKRVFYLGYCYFGPTLCQEVQNIFLKRHGYKNGERRWSIIIYSGYTENDTRRYSIELESCLENDVPDMIEQFNLEEEVTLEELRVMGWDGHVEHTAKIKHIFFPVYDDIQFPSFAQPLHRHQFGITTMAQSAGTPEFLAGKGLYAYTFYHEARCGFVWMNLRKYSTNEIKTVPVRIVGKLSKDFKGKHFKQRSSSFF